MIFFRRYFCLITVITALFSQSATAEQELSPVQKKEDTVILVHNQRNTSFKDPVVLLANHTQRQQTAYVNNANPQEADILPHRATYAISLDKTFDPEIRDVTGTMTAEVSDAGAQWIYEKKAIFLVSYHDNTIEYVTIKVASWESKEEKKEGEGGPQYHFYTKVKRGLDALSDDEDLDDQVTLIQGDALMATAQGEGVVTYKTPEGLSIQLPIGTLFPMRHMAQLMHNAVHGQNVCSHIVFDGENESNESLRVNTVITPLPKSNVKFSDLVPFSTDHMWLMHMAVYDINADEDNPDPDYEISHALLPHGIIARMSHNFGDFKAQLVLTELEFFNE